MIHEVKYAHTNLVARDYQSLARFYQEVFGCRPVPPERDYAGPALEAGTALPGASLKGIHLRLPGMPDAGPTLEIFEYSELAEYGRVDQAFFKDLLGRVLAEAETLDKVIAEHADRGLDQLDPVARGILLLAMTELRFRDDVPVKVVIDEAIKLAKRYGATDSYRFVNAVVDKAAKTLRASAEVAAG